MTVYACDIVIALIVDNKLDIDLIERRIEDEYHVVVKVEMEEVDEPEDVNMTLVELYRLYIVVGGGGLGVIVLCSIGCCLMWHRSAKRRKQQQKVMVENMKAPHHAGDPGLQLESAGHVQHAAARFKQGNLNIVPVLPVNSNLFGDVSQQRMIHIDAMARNINEMLTHGTASGEESDPERVNRDHRTPQGEAGEQREQVQVEARGMATTKGGSVNLADDEFVVAGDDEDDVQDGTKETGYQTRGATGGRTGLDELGMLAEDEFVVEDEEEINAETQGNLDEYEYYYEEE